MADIKSKDNKFIKLVRQLETKKIRDELSLFVVEGPNLIVEAIKEHAEINVVLVRENCDGVESKNLVKHIKDNNIEYFTVDNELFNSIADTKASQGFLGVVGKKKYSIDSAKENNSFMIVIDKLQDPGNLGTIIRTCDAAGVSCIGIIKGSGDIYSSKVVRATAGAIFRVPFVFFENEDQALQIIRSSGRRILCTTVSGGKSYFDEDLKGRIALVIGNEGSGASKELIDNADQLVTIPMKSDTESLNAAVAASIIIYESVRQNM
ncbi:MAG: RNA methyltransferase [Eubacteriales bacterium]